MNYTKSDMLYNDYSWTTYEHDNPKITGVPDSTLLNRKEGYEILYFVNKFSEMHRLDPKTNGNKIERMIRNNVPSHIHSQEGIRQWIFDNWSSY